MLEPIYKADAWLQKRFDAAIHAFMQRTGWSKYDVCRNAWDLVAALDVAAMIIPKLDVTLVGSILVLCMLAIRRLDHREDKQAVPGTRSWTDNRFTTGFRKLWGTQELLLIVFSAAYGTFSLRCMLPIWLFQGYLCATNPEEPKKQKEASRASSLQPSYSQL